MTFHLGTHRPYWLWKVDVPLFVSRRQLVRAKRVHRALSPWALDSGGFTVLSQSGRWDVCPQTYAQEVRRWRDEIGYLRWAAQQDWMCEPFVLEKTGLTVQDHQERTVANYLLLREIAPDLPWCPVLQGWTFDDYLKCYDLFTEAGVDLPSLPVVGLGSVCRRQDTTMAEDLIRHLHGRGLRLHGFGFKLQGLRRVAPYLASADSMAWSFDARRSSPLPGCEHATCTNCLRYALLWREKAVRAAQGWRQEVLFV